MTGLSRLNIGTRNEQEATKGRSCLGRPIWIDSNQELDKIRN